jgi:hypothetical protein
MPNYIESKSEKLMNELTEKLNVEQNELFSELLEGSSAMGKTTDDMIQEYQEYKMLTTDQIRDVFRVLVKVLIQHEKDSIENMEK